MVCFLAFLHCRILLFTVFYCSSTPGLSSPVRKQPLVWLAGLGTRAGLCSCPSPQCCQSSSRHFPSPCDSLPQLLQSQVIVSSCCSEIFSHRVTIALDSQTEAPLLIFRGSVPKHHCPLCWGGEGGLQVSLGRGFGCLEFLSLSFPAPPARSCSPQP